MPLATEILLLTFGTIFGAWVQARREKINKLREDVFDVMSDEILHAKISGNIDQTDGLTSYTEINELSKRRLPSPLRKEFSAYFQRSADLKDQKEIINRLKEQMVPQYSRRTDLLKNTDRGLKIVSDHEFIGQDVGYESTYSIDFEEWLLEYGPVISEILTSSSRAETVSGEEIEEALHRHNVQNDDLENIPDVWDSVAGEGNGGPRSRVCSYLEGPANTCFISVY